MKRLLCLTIFVVLIFGIGCAYHYKPTIYPIPPGTVAEFEGKSSVSIVNGCTQNRRIHLYTDLALKYYADTEPATDAAIQVLKNELISRGFRVSESGDKQITLTVQNINSTQTFCVYFYIHKITTTL